MNLYYYMPGYIHTKQSHLCYDYITYINPISTLEHHFRLCTGRLGSPIEERWVSDSPSSSKDTQRMPVTMPPENCTANNKRRGETLNG